MSTPAELAANRLAFEMQSWRSIELQVRHGISRPTEPERRPDYDHLIDHYTETAVGWRKNDNTSFDGATLNSHSQAYFDGSRYAQVGFARDELSKQSQVIIKRSFEMEDKSASTSRPVPLSCLYLGQTPLPEALRKAVHLGTEEVLGRRCDRFLFTDLKWDEHRRHQVFSLDQATAIPLRILTYQDANAYSAGKILLRWEAESLDRVQGHWVPLRSKGTLYSPESGSPSLFRAYDVQEVAFDRPFAKSAFWPVVQPGVPVFDATVNKLTRSPGPKPQAAAKPAVAPASTAVPTVATPAVPPADWTASLPNLGLGLGIASLAVGLLLWWRRR